MSDVRMPPKTTVGTPPIITGSGSLEAEYHVATLVVGPAGLPLAPRIRLLIAVKSAAVCWDQTTRSLLPQRATRGWVIVLTPAPDDSLVHSGAVRPMPGPGAAGRRAANAVEAEDSDRCRREILDRVTLVLMLDPFIGLRSIGRECLGLRGFRGTDADAARSRHVGGQALLGRHHCR